MSELQGTADVLKMFAELPIKVHAAVDRQAMNQATEIVAEAAKNNLDSIGAVDSGELLASIRATRAKIRGKLGEMTTSVVTAFYGRFVEHGFMHTGGKHIAARPFLVPALEQNEEKILEKVGEVIKRATDLHGKVSQRALNRALKSKVTIP